MLTKHKATKGLSLDLKKDTCLFELESSYLIVRHY